MLTHNIMRARDRGRRPLLVGMVHLAPLPGSPGWRGSMDEVVERAIRDASVLAEGGFGALLVENMGDVPYLRGRAEPETVAAMSVAAAEVARLGLPVGVQVLAGAHRETLAVALAVGARFLRVEAFAYGHVADEGWLNGCAGELLRRRRDLGVEVEVWADVRKKHAAHAATADLSLEELGRGTVFCGADALVVTGRTTGDPPPRRDLERLAGLGVPLAVGSGLTPENAGDFADLADVLIVGSALKEDGDWRRPVDPERVKRFVSSLART